MLLIIFCSLLSVIYGKYIIDIYKSNTIEVISEYENIYILQQGVYSTFDNANKNSKDLYYYIVEKDDKYYRVYVGITQNKENSEKVKGIYKGKGKDIYVWEKQVNNNEFLEALKQYDNMLNEKNEEKDILEVEKKVLEKYEELIIKNNGEND